MDTQDARTLPPEAQAQLRKQAIRLKQKGMSFVDIATVVAVHPIRSPNGTRAEGKNWGQEELEELGSDSN